MDDKELVVVLLNSKSMDARWIETWKLAKWATSRLNKIKKFQQTQKDRPIRDREMTQ